MMLGRDLNPKSLTYAGIVCIHNATDRYAIFLFHPNLLKALS